MKGPTRPAPSVPGVNRYSPVTNWNDDPFGADLFEPAPCTQKKMPPPRPPPPKINNKQPDVPVKPSYFVRKPTVLSSLLSRKKNATSNQNNYANHSNALLTDLSSDVDTTKVFPKCEPKNLQTGTLIDFSSPPSSPTFTTRSSSDGLSVDSFGSDATTSTNHHNPNNGNASQAESGFEDDFDLFLNSRKNIPKDDTFDDFTTIDPFSPQPLVNKPPIKKKPIFNKDVFEMQGTNQPVMMKGPTIIRAKPARPKPPENSALLKNTFGSSYSVTNNNMTINTTTPIQKISNGFGDNFDSKPLSWESSPERESSPPMPSIPPPPPPPVVDEDLPLQWPEDVPDFVREPSIASEDEEKPYAIALFDYFTDHPDDLCFSANAKINLIRRVDNEWLYGSAGGGAEGLFPASYVEVRAAPGLGAATALYDFEPAQPGDLAFRAGDKIALLQKLSDEWYFGECNGVKGQFPVNYVQFS